MINLPSNDDPFTTCDLYDALGDEAQVIGSELQGFGGRRRFAGSAATIKCFEDNGLVRQAVHSPGNGRVLVVDGGGSRHCAFLGDMLAKAAISNGWAGIIVDGCVRDSSELLTLDIGVMARGTTPRKAQKLGEGQRDVPVTIAGICIGPGDRIFVDEDGILVTGQRL